jgi:hypothetical protein
MMPVLEPEILEKASLAKDPFEVVGTELIFKQQKMIRELMRLTKAKRLAVIYACISLIPTDPKTGGGILLNL